MTPLPIGLFLGISISLGVVLLILEVWGFYQRRHITISELSHKHRYLRWLIELAVVLIGVWWPWHSATLR